LAQRLRLVPIASHMAIRGQWFKGNPQRNKHRLTGQSEPAASNSRSLAKDRSFRRRATEAKGNRQSSAKRPQEKCIKSESALDEAEGPLKAGRGLVGPEITLSRHGWWSLRRRLLTVSVLSEMLKHENYAIRGGSTAAPSPVAKDGRGRHTARTLVDPMGEGARWGDWGAATRKAPP